MIVDRKVLMKHSFHKAKDLKIQMKANFISRKIQLLVDWIDTSLLESFITVGAVQMMNEELEKLNKLPLIENLNGFNIELIVANSSQFSLQYVRSEVEPRDNTLVMQLIKI